MSSDKSYLEILFFLGAGASIDAGLVGVVELKHEFIKWLENNSKFEHLNLTNEILTILETRKAKRGDKNAVDIELLLEIAEKIENKDEDPLSDFYENKMLKLERDSSYNSIMKIKKELLKIKSQITVNKDKKTNILEN